MQTEIVLTPDGYCAACDIPLPDHEPLNRIPEPGRRRAQLLFSEVVGLLFYVKNRHPKLPPRAVRDRISDVRAEDFSGAAKDAVAELLLLRRALIAHLGLRVNGFRLFGCVRAEV